VGALYGTQTRLAEGIVEAEAELVRARVRCRELRETLALARAREAAAVVTPVREPDARERQKRVRIAELTEGILASYAQTVPGRPIPRKWLPALMSMMRLDAERFPEIFTPNTVLQWSGGGSLGGLHLGGAAAARVATELAAHIEPGSIRVDELTGSDQNLEVLARATFTAAGVQPPRFETTIHGVFRFDDGGRIALVYLTPYDADALEAYLP
jgi:hypothetical protein